MYLKSYLNLIPGTESWTLKYYQENGEWGVLSKYIENIL